MTMGARMNGDERVKVHVCGPYDRGREVYSRPGKFLMI